MISNIPYKVMDELLYRNETALWSGKPSWKVFFEQEIRVMVISMFLVLWMVVPILSGFLSFEGMSFGSLMQNLPILFGVIFVALLLNWLFWVFKKAHTWFFITDQRLLGIRYYGGNVRVTAKKLDDLKNFEVRYSKNGGSIYLGKYRLIGYVSRFDYEVNRKESLYYLPDQKFKDLFCFYSLEDVDAAAAIIRKHTNAKEYIDPKMRRKK